MIHKVKPIRQTLLAIRFDEKALRETIEFCGKAFYFTPRLYVPTLIEAYPDREVHTPLEHGDWIIKRPEGTFFKGSNKWFKAHYEEVR